MRFEVDKKAFVEVLKRFTKVLGHKKVESVFNYEETDILIESVGSAAILISGRPGGHSSAPILKVAIAANVLNMGAFCCNCYLLQQIASNAPEDTLEIREYTNKDTLEIVHNTFRGQEITQIIPPKKSLEFVHHDGFSRVYSKDNIPNFTPTKSGMEKRRLASLIFQSFDFVAPGERYESKDKKLAYDLDYILLHFHDGNLSLKSTDGAEALIFVQSGETRYPEKLVNEKVFVLWDTLKQVAKLLAPGGTIDIIQDGDHLIFSSSDTAVFVPTRKEIRYPSLEKVFAIESEKNIVVDPENFEKALIRLKKQMNKKDYIITLSSQENTIGPETFVFASKEGVADLKIKGTQFVQVVFKIRLDCERLLNLLKKFDKKRTISLFVKSNTLHLAQIGGGKGNKFAKLCGMSDNIEKEKK